MAEIKEIHKEKIIYRDGEGPHVHSEYHEEPTHPDHEDRHDYRGRREVRRLIVGFRRTTYFFLDIVEIILILEFFVKLFGFNPLNPVVRLIDVLSYPLYAPFAGIMTAVTPYFIINWSILVAMIVYALLAYLIIAVFAASVRASYRSG